MLIDSEVWWSRIPGPDMLVQKLAYQAAVYESCILSFHSPIPWSNHLGMVVKDIAQQKNPELLMEYVDAAEIGSDIGRWLLNRDSGQSIFCLPSQNPLEVALENGRADNLIFWVSGCSNREQVNLWQGLAGKLKSRKNSKSLVILILEDSVKADRTLPVLKAADNISTNDLSFFAASLVTGLKISLFEKRYLSNLAYTMCFNSAEQCAEIVSYRDVLLRDPMKFNTTSTDAEKKHAIWRAQLSTIFAAIEEAKQSILETHATVFAPLIGTTDDFGNRIEALEDIELRHIVHELKRKRLVLPTEMEKKLRVLHNCRNELAHHHILTFADMEKTSRYITY